MAEVTYYVALPFVATDHGMTAGEPTECFNPNAAVMRAEPRAVGDLVHVEKFFARNLHTRTRVPGRLGKATSRTPSMYVDEKSDEAIVLAKRLNKGRQLPAEVVEGRASPKGNSR
jgi:sirohydrochlorin ferrochelatase